MVHGHALAEPERLAFEWAHPDGDLSLTYGGLTERVHRLGHALHAAGIGSGSKVAICMESRPAWPVAFLATWYAGGTVVPLDTQLDSKALGLLLDHAGAIACVTSPEHTAKLVEACRGLSTPPELMLVDVEGPSHWDGDPVEGADPGGAPRPGDDQDPLLPGSRSENTPSRSFDALVDEFPLPPEAAWAPFGAGDEIGTISYTSGTTGDPKGVMIRRSSWAVNIDSGIQVIEIDSKDRLLGILPLFHVLPILTNCLGPAYLGACVVFLSDLTAEKILAAFRKYRITIFICVPAFFYRFHDRVLGQIRQLSGLRSRLARLVIGIARVSRRRLGINAGRKLLPAIHRPFGDELRLFVTGAAKISASVVEDFLDWGFALAQGYGLTEATAILAISPLDGLRGDAVGPAIPGVEMKIHDPDADGIGEIWARSPSLMEGYYKNPEATAAVLVDGWLRTGDLGRIQPDGFIQVTGRAKDMIVLASGKNIYPDELEEHYVRCDLIKELSIIGLPDPEGRGERLHGVIVPDLEAARRRGYVNVREMVKWEIDGLAAELPSSRRLTSIEIRNEPLPRTTTRKVKRFELIQEAMQREQQSQAGAGETAAHSLPPAAPSADSDSAGGIDTDGEAAAGIEPAGETPEWVTTVEAIIARLADRDSVGHDEHLDLDLGLESLDRVELLAEIQDTVGVELGTEVAGELHTVGEVIEAVRQRHDEGPAAARAPADRDRWRQILAGVPEGLGPYLRRRPVAEVLLWIIGRCIGTAFRLGAGLRSTGHDNLPDEYPFMLCPNHLSYADPVMLAMVLPLRVFRRLFFVGYSEYFEGWFGSRLGRLFRNIPIDQNRQLEKAMQAAAEGLRRDMVLVIFPEGGRSIDGDLREFRKGAGILAQYLDVPIVPVGLWGTYEMWRRGGKLRRHPVGVAVGEPLEPADGESPQALMEKLVERVSGLVGVAAGLYGR
jgi:long-chain acyl-CoA synthetase